MDGPDPHARPLVTDLERYTGEHYRPPAHKARHIDVSLAVLAVTAIGIFIILIAVLLAHR